ncbi:Lipase, class 3 [Corchorus olitorius]|uniref:Lipase, class 3 n=1 Tax=Corchorus olitorius TaxID=93759 RepID=A0A1R3KQF1_9ROSI|nr:Lipase, class 3 [Corchorus olitorius]
MDSHGLTPGLTQRACSIAMKAHKSTEKPYLVESCPTSSSDIFFSFPGSWSVPDWFTRPPFGEIKIDRSQFLSHKGVATSLRSIGRDELARVNEGFLKRLELILNNSSLQTEVEKAIADKKRIVFTGHSFAGGIAMLATVWYLEHYFKKSEETGMSPLCVTFGSPLVADFILNQALSREKWSNCFIHFVMRYDIVPRVLLAPLSSMERDLQQILHLFNQKAINPSLGLESIREEASRLYKTVMRHASAVASHAASQLMKNTNPILETVASFIEISPYRPCGTFVFCIGDGKLVELRNADAILQLLFYSSQLCSENELDEVVERSLNSHFSYASELEERLSIGNAVYLDNLQGLPLSTVDENIAINMKKINMALNDLGLSTRAKLCLRAAGEQEKQKLSNQQRVDAKKKDIEDGLAMLEEYKTKSAVCNVGYYDAFKISKDEDDFKANVKRLELTGIWDEIVEMLNKNELPEGFESQREWVELATRYRRIVEPLDVANYYRHAKNEDTGPYMDKGRPKRYRYTQRWREHALRMPIGSSSESCFWAEVEELQLHTSTGLGAFDDVRERILNLEKQLEEWSRGGHISKDVFLEGSTFTKWWITLPHQHKSLSCLNHLIKHSTTYYLTTARN